ncbi:C6 finger domain [Colletotrichum truncatum]|uniref:C6 finger domain n=1 Tax=Colletotrichum truncatum TaxID=5467 RepID=A0ACC3ZGN6_COLTU
MNDCLISSTSQLSFPLSQLGTSNPAAESLAPVIRQAIASYPLMMLRRTTFPPFIHPHRDKSRLPEPLANCMGIAALFASRNNDTRPFLWKSIWEEQERCLREMPNWSKYEIFAAMQAEIIYIMMRVVDGCARTPQHREYNMNMLFAYKAFWNQLLAIGVATCGVDRANGEIDWEDWVMEESLTRIACVWFIVAQISCVKVGIDCSVLEVWDTLRLPCHKAQWAATTLEDWKEETDALQYLHSRGKPPTNFAELYQLSRGTNGMAGSDRLDSWNAGVDNIGVLLNVVVNML